MLKTDPSQSEKYLREGDDVMKIVFSIEKGEIIKNLLVTSLTSCYHCSHTLFHSFSFSVSHSHSLSLFLSLFVSLPLSLSFLQFSFTLIAKLQDTVIFSSRMKCPWQTISVLSVSLGSVDLLKNCILCT